MGQILKSVAAFLCLSTAISCSDFEQTTQSPYQGEAGTDRPTISRAQKWSADTWPHN